MSAQKYFNNLLNQNVAVIKPLTQKFTKKIAQKLIERIQQMKLYAKKLGLGINL